MLQAHGHRVITYERNNNAGGLAQKLLLPLRAIYSTKTVREVRALIRKEQVDSGFGRTFRLRNMV